MNILLCLLSDQHVPNLLSVHHFHPDRLVLVESAAMEKRQAAAHFLAALKLGGLDYDLRSEIEPLDAEDKLDAVRQTLQRAYGKHASARWIVNLTGGTKPMSIAAYEFFKALNGRLIYTNVTRPSEFQDIDANQIETCQHNVSVKEFLAGYGFESAKKDSKLREANERAGRWFQCARQIALTVQSQDLLNLSNEEREKGRDKGLQLQERHLQVTDSQLWGSIAKAFGRAETVQGLLDRKLPKHEFEFLTGGWLEVLFYGLLSHHARDLAIWDVQLGLEVRRKGVASGNELDVAFMHNSGLAVAECKSGDQQHDKEFNALHKVEAVVRQFRAVRVRSYFATTGNNIFDKDGRIKESIENRAAIYQCRILSREQIRQLAQSAENPDVVRQVMFPASEH